MEPMICETFLQFRYLSDLGLSPDGRYTAYIRQQANLASNGYDARLWVYDHSTGADRPLSSLSPVRAFSWMDNRTILFSGHEPPESGQSESPGGSFGPGGIQKPHL